jgi:lactoylglutathione lyase
MAGVNFVKRAPIGALARAADFPQNHPFGRYPAPAAPLYACPHQPAGVAAMKLTHLILSGLIIVAATSPAPSAQRTSPMQLGNFSVSLAVKDIKASKAFYEKLGFVQVFGEADQGWAIMKNGAAKIGLFQGMFPTNTLTFNPGWDADGKPDAKSEDIRAIQKRLKAAGLDTGAEIDSPQGPAHFTLTDPDGNPILLDQHV